LKYRQNGYKDDDRDEEQRGQREDRAGGQERRYRDPELPGGRLADKHRVIRNLRCHHCGKTLPLELDARGDVMSVPWDAACTQCEKAVHACRNCKHFDPDAAFECRRSVKDGYRKGEANACVEFDPKLVAEMTRDESRSAGSFAAARPANSPRPSKEGRQAFEDLFNK
jgi:hypothetical protein